MDPKKCINKSLKTYKDLAERYGETLASSIIRKINRSSETKPDEFYIPSISEAKKLIKESKLQVVEKFDNVIKMNPFMKERAILDYLQGVVTRKDNTVFVVKGYEAGMLDTEIVEKEIFQQNLKIVEDLKAKYPDIFEISPTPKRNVVVVKITPRKEIPVSPIPSNLIFPQGESFNKELFEKIQNKLQGLYPGIKLNITNTPIWEKGDTAQTIGEANIKAMTVLIDAANQKQDTLPHEYAHHYIAWFRNTPIVQEAIQKWGSEEALVQSIGEQAVKQKGEAWDWWEKFTKFVMDLFNNLSTKDKQELTNILTDAFLKGVNLETGEIGISEKTSLELAKRSEGLFNQRIPISYTYPLEFKLQSYLEQFGFTTEQLDDLKDTTGYSIIGATDFLEKTIFVQKENIDKAYTKEAAYVIFNLLGKKNILRKELISSIDLLKNYNDLKSKYVNSKLSDYQIRELIAIDYLQNKLIEAHKEALPTKGKAVSKDVTAKNKLEYYTIRIKKWWSDLLKKFFKSYRRNYIEDVFNQIANDVINNNTRLFNLSKNIPYSKIEFTKEQQKINDDIVSLGAINSGSYSLNRQGTLTREKIGDLDYFLPYHIKDTFIKELSKKYPQAVFSEPYAGVMGNRSLTLSVKIDNTKIDFFLPVSQEESDKNKIVIIDGVKHHYWKNIFDAKIRIGSQKHLSDLAGFVPFQKEWNLFLNESFDKYYIDNKNEVLNQLNLDLTNAENAFESYKKTYSKDVIDEIFENVFKNKKYADNNDPESKEKTKIYWTYLNLMDTVSRLKNEISNVERKIKKELSKDPIIKKYDTEYLNIVGQRHYNFDFIQSKFNKEEYASSEPVNISPNVKSYWDKNLEQTAFNYFKSNNIDFKKSKQYQDLLNYFNNNEKKAIVAYYLTFSENFKKFYGNIPSRVNKPSFIINYVTGNYSKPSVLVDEEGEPVIFYHGAGTIFDKFSKDYFLSGEGAMAYGAGFYSTNNKPTADNYRDTAKSAMDTFRKLLDEGDQRLLNLIDKLKIDINESQLIRIMSGSLDIEDTQSKTELLNLLGLTETKALYIALTNPLYWENDISPKNKQIIEDHFKVKLSNKNSGKIYRELEKTLKISDKELSARLYQIGIDGVITIKFGGMAVGGFRHEKGEKHVIFFEPIQAKAVNNSGLFSLNNENMYDPIEIKEKSEIKEEPKAPIKPGVEELFESNPKLANAVYEAVGVDVFQLKEDVDVTNAFLTARQHEEAKRINSGEFDDTKLDLKTELQNIIDNSINPLLVELAKSIQNKKSLKTIKAYSTQKLFKTKEGFEPAAAYQAETQRLVLFLGNTARFENKEREYQYLLHELVHHFVDRELVLTNSKQAENIRQLFKYTKYQLTKAGKENLYGLTNFHEFVTEALTNPDFQKELKNLQVPDQFLTKSFSIFDYFLELISKILGTNKSVLEAVVSQAADIFELQEYKKSLSITPQQKQQALQLYSQYLDSITNEPIVYKGLRDKSTKVHDTPNHSYFTPDKNIADKWYKDEKGVKTFVIPKVESVEFRSDSSQGVSKFRKDEENFINNAQQPLIKLDTYDIGFRQIQYVLNKNIAPLELGTEKDIKEFKQFIEKSDLSKTAETFEKPEKVIKFTSFEDIEKLKKGKPC